MIVTCPGCATRYEVPETAFGNNGRRVRCKSCSFIWHAVPDDAMPDDTLPDDAMPDDASAGIDLGEDDDALEFGAGEPDIGEVDPREPNPEFNLADHLAEAKRLERNLASIGHTTPHRSDLTAGKTRRRLPTGLTALAATIALIVGAAYEYREALVRAVPQTATLYELVGLEVNIRGMEFANIVVERQFENGLPVLAVRGEIVNITGRSLHVPRLRFGLRDHSEQEIYHWTMSVATGQLAPEGRANFLTKLAAPPQAAQHVEVRFYDVGSRRAGN